MIARQDAGGDLELEYVPHITYTYGITTSREIEAAYGRNKCDRQQRNIYLTRSRAEQIYSRIDISLAAQPVRVQGQRNFSQSHDRFYNPLRVGDCAAVKIYKFKGTHHLAAEAESCIALFKAVADRPLSPPRRTRAKIACGCIDASARKSRYHRSSEIVIFFVSQPSSRDRKSQFKLVVSEACTFS
uniref:Uncharacterized protein n=1 Tax=Trichogramma kaykai TaxID=54128 RepID=A0ABD2W3Z5_9HYME